MTIYDFTKFEAWIKAMEFATKIYALTESFPKDERY